MMKKTLAIAVLGLLAAPFLTLPVEAKHCKSKHIWARGSTKLTCLAACASAKKAWREKVADRYGSEYASYNRAEGARVVCVEDEGIKEWCSATGRPCRP